MNKKQAVFKGDVSSYLDKNHGIIVDRVFDGKKWVECYTEEYKAIMASFNGGGNQS